MKLVPLKQWICDTCGEIITSPEDGYMEIARDEYNRITDMCIVHHKLKSPRGSCYRNYVGSLSLEDVTGKNGIPELLSFLDPGEDFGEYSQRVINVRKFTDVFRRLYIPYYEEARLYWNRARNDGYFDGENEVRIFESEHLKELCMEYRKKEK